MEDKQTIIGKSIRFLRESYSLSQIELANYFNVTKAAVSQWENGQGIKTENLFDLASFFRVKIEDMISFNAMELYKSLNKDYVEEIKKQYLVHSHSPFMSITKTNKDEIKEYLGEVARLHYLYIQHVYQFIESSECYESKRVLVAFISYYQNQNEIYSFLEHPQKYKELGGECLDHFIHQTFLFNLDIEPMLILKSEDEELIKPLLRILTPLQRDRVFTDYLKTLNEKEIEHSTILKLLDKENSWALFSEDDFQEDVFEGDVSWFEGGIYEDYRKEEAEELIDKMKSNHQNAIDLDYDDYQRLINTDRSFEISEKINKKLSNPVHYYENMKRRVEEKLSSDNLSRDLNDQSLVKNLF